MLTDEYVKRVYAQVEERDPDQKEFLQAVQEVFESIEPVFAKHPEYADVLADPDMEKQKAEMLAGPACGLRR